MALGLVWFSINFAAYRGDLSISERTTVPGATLTDIRDVNDGCLCMVYDFNLCGKSYCSLSLLDIWQTYEN